MDAGSTNATTWPPAVPSDWTTGAVMATFCDAAACTTGAVMSTERRDSFCPVM